MGPHREKLTGDEKVHKILVLDVQLARYMRCEMRSTETRRGKNQLRPWKGHEFLQLAQTRAQHLFALAIPGISIGMMIRCAV